MILIDVNVLVYAHRPDAHNHSQFRDWLTRTLESNMVFGLSDTALSGMIRIVTHPGIFPDPTPLNIAFAFANGLREHPACVLVHPGERHWEIFDRLCQSAGAKGNLITDAYFAALAIEAGAEWITADRDYARFPGLKWRHPLG